MEAWERLIHTFFGASWRLRDFYDGEYLPATDSLFWIPGVIRLEE